MYQQMEYVQKRNLGYDRQNLIIIPIEGELVTNYAWFKERLSKLPGIAQVSRMGQSPTGIGHHTNGISWPGKDPDAQVKFAKTSVGYDFVKTMNLHLRAGRDFSKAYATDSVNFLLN